MKIIFLKYLKQICFKRVGFGDFWGIEVKKNDTFSKLYFVIFTKTTEKWLKLVDFCVVDSIER